MNAGKRILFAIGAGALALGLGAGAGAQDLGSAMKGLGGGMDPGSIASSNAGNAAGVIEYCIRNNYLSGDAASSIKEGLMGKFAGGQPAEENADFASGAKGLVQVGDGQSFDLAQFGDLKKSMTRKACDSVLEHAKSLL